MTRMMMIAVLAGSLAASAWHQPAAAQRVTTTTQVAAEAMARQRAEETSNRTQARALRDVVADMDADNRPQSTDRTRAVREPVERPVVERPVREPVVRERPVREPRGGGGGRLDAM